MSCQHFTALQKSYKYISERGRRGKWGGFHIFWESETEISRGTKVSPFQGNTTPVETPPFSPYKKASPEQVTHKLHTQHYSRPKVDREHHAFQHATHPLGLIMPEFGNGPRPLIIRKQNVLSASVSYDDCCLMYVKELGKKTQERAVKYRLQETDGGCNIRAVVFTMRKGRVYCSDPQEMWVQELMASIDKKAVKHVKRIGQKHIKGRLFG